MPRLRRPGPPLALLPLIALMGCGEGLTLRNVCVDDAEGFDIEQASVLEDAQGFPGMHDAILLDGIDCEEALAGTLSEEELAAGCSWRPVVVEVLAMVPSSEWASFTEGDELTVEVWDAADPREGERYTLTQRLVAEGLEWEEVTLANPTEALQRNQVRAWWAFDFSAIIPEEGLGTRDYVVGVHWGGSGEPTIGYSNFNRGCDRNFTDYGDGRGFVLNSEDNLLPGQPIDTCSWPMLRVETEIRSEREDCDSRSAEG